MSKPTLKAKPTAKEQYSMLLDLSQRYLAEMANRDDAAEYQKLIDLAKYYLAEVDDSDFWRGLNVTLGSKDYYLLNNLKISTSALSCRIEDAGYCPDIPDDYIFTD